MGFERLNFSKNWNSATDFPTLETSETQVRADMQLLHDESKNALNALMEALEQGGSDVLVRFGSEEVRYIRMNDSGGLEVSSDGVNYSIVSTGSAGGSAGGAAPATHASQHKTGGTDPIKPADIGAQPAVTGAATTITGSNLTANRALVSNGSGKVAVSSVTATELGYLDGVTSSIQNQLNKKAASDHTHTPSSIGAAASNHTHTPSSIGAVPSADVRFKFYNRLDDIGLTAGSETIPAIFNAMPNNSVLRYLMTSAHNAEIYPKQSQYGQVEFVRMNQTYGHATCWLDSTSVRGTYELHQNGSNITGWFKVYTEGQKPTPAEIGALALAGGGLTGGLSITKTTYPQVDLINTTTGRMSSFIGYDTGAAVLMNRKDSANRQFLMLARETDAADTALTIARDVNGDRTTYTVLHSGNATAQLNALGVAPWVETGSYTGTGDNNTNVTITFSKVPKFISIYGEGTVSGASVKGHMFVDVELGVGYGWTWYTSSSSAQSPNLSTARASVSGATVTLSSIHVYGINYKFKYNWVAHG